MYFNQSTGRWVGRYSTDDPESGLSVREVVYGHTEQEARAKLIGALMDDGPASWCSTSS